MMPGIRRCLLLILLLASLMVLTGCSQASDYKVFTLTEGVAHFSFQYPIRYSVDAIKTRNQYTEVTLRGSIPWWAQQTDNIFLLFTAYPSDTYPDPTAYLESDLSLFSESLPDFKLLEQFQVILVVPAPLSEAPGLLVYGQEIAYSYTLRTRLGEELRLGARPRMGGRVAYFDCAGLIWVLDMRYGMDQQETTEFEFYRMLHTFKILD